MEDCNYGKIVNGELQYSPYPLKIDGYDVYGAKEEQYRQAGYKPVKPIFDDYDELTQDLVLTLEEDSRVIYKHYKAHKKEEE